MMTPITPTSTAARPRRKARPSADRTGNEVPGTGSLSRRLLTRRRTLLDDRAFRRRPSGTRRARTLLRQAASTLFRALRAARAIA